MVRLFSAGVRVLSVAAVLSGWAPLTLAQPFADPPEPVVGTPAVSAMGTATIKKAPDTLRMQVQLQATGKDLKEALAALKARQDAARKQLVALGAAEKSLTFDPPAVEEASNDRQRQMEMMVRARMGNHGKPGAAPEAAVKPVSVNALLKAEWSLKAGAPEATLATAYELREKVKAADLAGAKAAATRPASEEEEEAGGIDETTTMDFDEQNGPKPGEPVFVYVARITDAERDKALAEAYQKAAAEAKRLAAAAGLSASGPLQLSSHASHGDTNNPWAYSSPYNRYMMQMMAGAEGGDEDDAAEAVGVRPGDVTLRVTVMSSFKLEKK